MVVNIKWEFAFENLQIINYFKFEWYSGCVKDKLRIFDRFWSASKIY